MIGRSIPVEIDETEIWSPFPEHSLEEGLDSSGENRENFVPINIYPLQVSDASSESTASSEIHILSMDKTNNLLRSRPSSESPDTGHSSSSVHRGSSDFCQNSFGGNRETAKSSQTRDNRPPLDLPTEDAGYDSQPLDVMGIRQLEPPLTLTSEVNLQDLPRALISREFPQAGHQLYPVFPPVHPNASPQAHLHSRNIPDDMYCQNPCKWIRQCAFFCFPQAFAKDVYRILSLAPCVADFHYVLLAIIRSQIFTISLQSVQLNKSVPGLKAKGKTFC